jgi:hypothetical protein
MNFYALTAEFVSPCCVQMVCSEGWLVFKVYSPCVAGKGELETADKSKRVVSIDEENMPIALPART